MPVPFQGMWNLVVTAAGELDVPVDRGGGGVVVAWESVPAALPVLTAMVLARLEVGVTGVNRVVDDVDFCSSVDKSV